MSKRIKDNRIEENREGGEQDSTWRKRDGYV